MIETTRIEWRPACPGCGATALMVSYVLRPAAARLPGGDNAYTTVPAGWLVRARGQGLQVVCGAPCAVKLQEAELQDDKDRTLDAGAAGLRVKV